MNSYTMHQVGRARQHERIASAHRAYDATQARANARPSRASHTTDVQRPHPLSWLRGTIGGIAAHFTARTAQPSHH